MRLIDADAFCTFLRDVSTRQKYETLLCNKDKFPTVADVIEAICCDLDGTSLNGFDNAPTVCFMISPDYVTELQNLNKKLVKQLEEVERPTGEWIIVKDEKWGDNVKCPFCGKELAGTDLNFCCKCGAKMGVDNETIN